MALSEAKLNTIYTVSQITAKSEDIKRFLHSLGCYPGEKVTIISKLASNYIINVNDARYSIDEGLAKAILV